MDLSDGSDAEDGDHRVPEEVNEDDLLGSSDDEDVDASDTRGGRFANSDTTTGSHAAEPLSTLNQSIDVEEEFLDLALGDEDDGLELTASDISTPDISPVKVKVLPSHVSPSPQDTPPISQIPTVPDTHLDGDGYNEAESEDQEHDHEDDLHESKQAETGDDDDDEEKGERSRFLSERPPPDGSKSSSSYTENVQQIRTLGDHFKFGNQHQFHYGNPRTRGNMRLRGNMPNHLQMRRGFRPIAPPHMMVHRNNHPVQVSRQIMNPPQHNSSRPEFRAAGPEIPVSQCSGQIFIDFNQPMLRNKNPLQLPPPPQRPNPTTPIVNPNPNQPSVNDQLPTPAIQLPVQQQPQPLPVPSPQKQCVAVRPQHKQPSPVANTRPPLQNNSASARPTMSQPVPMRPSAPRNSDFKPKRNPGFRPPLQQRPQFIPQQAFPPHQPPFVPQPQPPMPQIMHAMFMPNQQPRVFIPPQQNYVPPNFPYNVGGPQPPPGMMMHHPGQFDMNRFPSQGPPPTWDQASAYGPPPQFQGIPPGYFPPQQQHHFQPHMNAYTMEQRFPSDPNMQMLGIPPGYSLPPQQQQFQQTPIRPPQQLQQPTVVANITEKDRFHYEREPAGEQRRYDDYRSRSSGSSKRRSDDDEDYDRYHSTKHHRYTDSRYDDTRRPPSSRAPDPPPPVDPKTAELAKIIGETKKEMGIDDEYMAKMAEQKRLREEIMRKKGKRTEEPNPEPRAVKKTSIYINPAAFKGDLTLLAKQIQIHQNQEKMASTSNVKRKLVLPLSEKPNTILRKIVSSDGTIIRMEKLCKVKKTKKTIEEKK